MSLYKTVQAIQQFGFPMARTLETKQRQLFFQPLEDPTLSETEQTSTILIPNIFSIPAPTVIMVRSTPDEERLNVPRFIDNIHH